MNIYTGTYRREKSFNKSEDIKAIVGSIICVSLLVLIYAF